MKIEVKFFTSLREITGKRIDKLDIQKTSTLDELINLLIEKYGKKISDYIFNKNGDIVEFLSFLINGKNINTLQGFKTKLKENDVVAILPPIGGG